MPDDTLTAVERVRAELVLATKMEWSDIRISTNDASELLALAKQAQAAQKLGDWEFCGVCGGQFDGPEFRDSKLCPECESPKLPSQTVLVEALKPFASKAASIERRDRIWGRDRTSDGYTVAVTLGDCRRAHTAITEATNRMGMGDDTE